MNSFARKTPHIIIGAGFDCRNCSPSDSRALDTKGPMMTDNGGNISAPRAFLHPSTGPDSPLRLARSKLNYSACSFARIP
jgi:hypothetical protein